MNVKKTENKNKNSQLWNCKLCGNELSPYSPFCRNCGHPQKSVLAFWIVMAVLVLLVAVYLGMSLFCTFNLDKYRIGENSGIKVPG